MIRAAIRRTSTSHTRYNNNGYRTSIPLSSTSAQTAVIAAGGGAGGNGGTTGSLTGGAPGTGAVAGGSMDDRSSSAPSTRSDSAPSLSHLVTGTSPGTGMWSPSLASGSGGSRKVDTSPARLGNSSKLSAVLEGGSSVSGGETVAGDNKERTAATGPITMTTSTSTPAKRTSSPR